MQESTQIRTNPERNKRLRDHRPYTFEITPEIASCKMRCRTISLNSAPIALFGFIPASMFENAGYFEYFLRTAKADLLKFAPATGQKNISLEILEAVLIPRSRRTTPHRAKVDELIAVCDRLEASVITQDEFRRRHLDALLQRALAPAEQEVARDGANRG